MSWQTKRNVQPYERRAEAKVKLAIIVPYMRTGGVEIFIIRLYKYLVNEGHDVTVIATSEKGDLWKKLPAQNIKKYFHDVKIGFSPITQVIKLARYLVTNSFDVVVLNNDRYTQAILNFLPERTAAIPLIHIDADFAYEIGCANSSAWNVIVGGSPKVSSTLRKRLPGRPVEMIPIGADMPDVKLWHDRSMLGDHIKLLFVGRIEHEQKGVLLLPDIIEACLKRKINMSLTIVGDGSDMKELKRKINDKQQSDKVTYLGMLPHEKLYDELLSHHVLLMPSFFEGFPTIALEAQACGCVPVASRLSGITDHSIEDGITGILTEPGNIIQIVNAIETINNNPRKWKSMSSAGHARIDKMYSADSTGKAYLKLFTDVLNGKYPLPIPRNKYYPIDFSLMTWKDFVPNSIRNVHRVMKRVIKK